MGMGLPSNAHLRHYPANHNKGHELCILMPFLTVRIGKNYQSIVVTRKILPGSPVKAYTCSPFSV